MFVYVYVWCSVLCYRLPVWILNIMISNTNCCVPNCHSRKSKNPELSFHRFPKQNDKRKVWQIALKIGKPISDTMTVCSRHFTQQNFFFISEATKRHRLKIGAVPSQNLPLSSVEDPIRVEKKNVSALEREERYKQRKRKACIEAVAREDRVPTDNVQISSLDFEEHMFDSLNICPSDTKSITKKSEKLTTDPAIVTLQKEQDLTAQIFIGPDRSINKVRLKTGPARQPTTCVKRSRPITIEKATKSVPWSEPNGNANEPRVTQESENQPRECPIAPQKPCSSVGSVSIGPLREVQVTQESEEHPCAQDISLHNAMDETSSNGPEVPASKDLKSVPVRSRPKIAPVTSDGATNNVMKVNIVCPHCQKACKVCLSIKSFLLKTNVPQRPTNLQTDDNPKEPTILRDNKKNSFPMEAQMRLLKRQVQLLQQNKLSMRQKVKALQVSNRRLKTRNARLQETVRSVMEDKDDLGFS